MTRKFRNEVDIESFSIFMGVGSTRMCDFKRGCDGELSEVPIVVTVDEVMAARRKKYEQTGEPKHLEYENAFKRELAKKGRANPEIRRNFYLEDTVEEGNFVAGECLRSCARGSDVVVSMEQLYLGGDCVRRVFFFFFSSLSNKSSCCDSPRILSTSLKPGTSL